ncbi:MAG: hypothetical protein ACLPYS_08470 [Vulcanimicrobiaceae bacterium]
MLKDRPEADSPELRLGAAARAELRRLRRENTQLLMEREILSRVASWFIDDESLLAKNGTHDS